MPESYQTGPDDSIARRDAPQEEALERDTIVVEDPTMRRGFAMLPYIVIKSKRLSHGAKIAYALLLHYAWQEGSCYPGQTRMADDLNVARQSVGRYITELVDVGAIVVKRRGQGKTNIYRLPPLPEPLDGENPDVAKTVHQDAHASKAQRSARLEVTESVHPKVRQSVRNVYPGKKTQVKHADPPKPPKGGRKPRFSEDSEKFYVGPNAHCRRCGLRQCLCATS
jgi:hypothetical protein